MKAKANISELHTAGLIRAILQSPLASTYITLIKDGWKIVAVQQQRGRCYYADKTITIPVWAIQDTRKNYWIWYVAHEMSHASLDWRIQDNHGPNFMKALKQICPADCIHYELGYKPQNAAQAGIAYNETAHKSASKQVVSTNLLDLL